MGFTTVLSGEEQCRISLPTVRERLVMGKTRFRERAWDQEPEGVGTFNLVKCGFK